MKTPVYWVAAVAVTTLMTEAAKTCETLVNVYQTTRRYNPEDSHLVPYNLLYLFTVVCEQTYQPTCCHHRLHRAHKKVHMSTATFSFLVKNVSGFIKPAINI
jgi:hypothetical protein